MSNTTIEKVYRLMKATNLPKENGWYVCILTSTQAVTRVFFDGLWDTSYNSELFEYFSEVQPVPSNQQGGDAVVLPSDLEVAEWFSINIGLNGECSASSAIFKFRLWLKEIITYAQSSPTQEAKRVHELTEQLNYWKKRCEAAETLKEQQPAADPGDGYQFPTEK